MLKSMTAYGRGIVESGEGRISVEIHSVNRKFFDLNLILPKELLCLEPQIRKWISSAVARGQVAVRVNAALNELMPGSVRPNLALAKHLKEAWDALALELKIEPEGFDLKTLAETPGIFIYEDNDLKLEQCKALLKEALDKALENFLKMKVQEGKVLEQDILKRVELLERLIGEMASLAPEGFKKYREKLIKRIEEILPPNQELDLRIMQEVAVFAEKIDVTEEITRFRSHIEQFKGVIAGKEPSGKTLEFLLQELSREANTMTSKASDLSAVRIGLEMKGELEKIREQIQNVE